MLPAPRRVLCEIGDGRMPPVLTDKRNWFDTDVATAYARAGGGATLWRTERKAWVLQEGGAYTEQTAAAAFEWLVENGHAAAAQADLSDIWGLRAI
jgi:hypothetical protein